MSERAFVVRHMTKLALLASATLVFCGEQAMAQTAPAAASAGADGGTINLAVTPSSSHNISDFQKKVFVQTPPQPDAIAPDMFGARPWLAAHGIDMILDETNEFATTLKGYHKGTTNTGQYSWWTTVDWGKLAGLTGFSTHMIIVGRYGNDSSHLTGDAVSSSQEIYGSGGNVAAHLVEAYGEQSLFNGKLDLLVGVEPMLWDFAGSYLQCENFMNDALCGNPTIGYENGPYSVFPDWSYAVRAQIAPTKTIYIKFGVFYTQSNIYQAQNGFRSGFNFEINKAKRPTFPVELGWTPQFGDDGMGGVYKAGIIFDENTHPDDYYDNNGNPWVLSGLPPRTVKSAPSEYVMVNQMVKRNGPGDMDGLILFASYWHDASTWYTVGAVDRGFWKERPMDSASIGFVYATMPSYLTKTEMLQRELGGPVTGDYYRLQFNGNAPSGVQTSWPMLELQYQFHVTRGITFEPDFQYYFRPNAQANLPGAAFLGFRSYIRFF